MGEFSNFHRVITLRTLPNIEFANNPTFLIQLNGPFFFGLMSANPAFCRPPIYEDNQ